MPALPPETKSVWIETAHGPTSPVLEGDVEADVAVIGGGIVGITTAHLLKEQGKRVVVLEGSRLLSGVTGHTTAKLTSGHSLKYSYLEKHFGEDGARTYAQANQAAIDHVDRTSQQLGIDCDLERRDNTVYATTEDEVDQIRAEVDAERRAGLPAAFATELDLPYGIAAAVRLAGQAQFHPRKYLLPLAERLPGDGSHVFESSRVVSVEGGDPAVLRTNGGRVRARDVVVATNLPIVNRGLHFARAFPKRHYAVCGPADPDRLPEHMHLSTEEPTHSVRTVLADGERLLLAVGESHKVGRAHDTEERYARIADWAAERFGLRDVRYRWSAQDYYSADQVPYIGEVAPMSRRTWVATGFGGWGMTGGTIAGLILCDLILGRPNPWAALYRATRVKPSASGAELTMENTKIGSKWVRDRMARPTTDAGELAPGSAGIVTHDGARVAAYRDEAGALHAVSPWCTHMGCEVSWNAAERSWDCACHGSRFDHTGEVLNGPATRPLDRRA